MAENAAETKKEEAPADAAPAAAEDDGAAKEEESTATFEPVVRAVIAARCAVVGLASNAIISRTSSVLSRLFRSNWKKSKFRREKKMR